MRFFDLHSLDKITVLGLVEASLFLDITLFRELWRKKYAKLTLSIFAAYKKATTSVETGQLADYACPAEVQFC